MTVYLYRWKIKPGKESQFEKNWAIVTKAIREQCGSYGSRLHRTGHGEYLGYAQWPDLKTREACVIDLPSQEARKLMRDAIESTYPDVELSVKSDLLVFPE